MAKLFQRTIEDFTCENCGQFVSGNGYTNHCPKCLWSKHVDVNPGDRAGKCGGMMKPVGYEKKGDKYYVLQQCLVCKFQKTNTLNKDDNFDVLISIKTDY